MAAHLDYPCWCLLLAPQYPFCPDDARLWVDGAVHDVYAEDMAAVGIGVLVPHADDDMGPWVTGVLRDSRNTGEGSAGGEGDEH